MWLWKVWTWTIIVFFYVESLHRSYRCEGARAARHLAGNARRESGFGWRGRSVSCLHVVPKFLDIGGGVGASRNAAHTAGLFVRLFVNNQTSQGHKRLGAAWKLAREWLDSCVELQVKDAVDPDKLMFSKLLFLGKLLLAITALVRLRWILLFLKMFL